MSRERPGTDGDAIDGVVPDVVVSVDGTDEVAEVIARARAEKLGVVAVGGGTLLGIGNAPRRCGIRLELSGAESRLDHSPNDMVVTLPANLRLARAGEILAGSGQRLGLGAPNPGHASLGGIAATDFASGVAYSFGRPRDQILGMTVVDGNGRRLCAGGRVVKNVAGYDLPRLFAGSYGTLGVITELTLRTHPLPMCSETVRFDLGGWDALDNARAAAFASNLPLRSLDMAFDTADGRPRCSLRALVEGTSDEVAYQVRRLAELCRGDPRTGVDANDVGRAFDSQATFRIECRPSRSVELVASLLASTDAAGVRSRARAELGGRTIRWSIACDREADFPAAHELVRRVAVERRATFVVESAPPSAKRGIDVWGAIPAGIEIMKRIKARFDPLGILAPGRFVGGI